MSVRWDRNQELSPFQPQDGDDLVICRCEEVTQGEIRRAVHEGMFTMTEIRRYLRTGMGLCQGGTCEKLVRNIIARELGVSPAQTGSWTARSPQRPMEMHIFGNEVGEE